MKKHCFYLNQTNSRVIYRRSLNQPAALGVSHTELCSGSRRGKQTFNRWTKLGKMRRILNVRQPITHILVASFVVENKSFHHSFYPDRSVLISPFLFLVIEKSWRTFVMLVVVTAVNTGVKDCGDSTLTNSGFVAHVDCPVLQSSCCC